MIGVLVLLEGILLLAQIIDGIVFWLVLEGELFLLLIVYDVIEEVVEDFKCWGVTFKPKHW